MRAIFVGFFAITYWLTQRFRAHFTPNPCHNCPLGTYPFCKGNQAHVARLASELQRRAGPEDDLFVGLIASLLKSPNGNLDVELISVGQVADSQK
jgi:hypothetical protein